MNNTIKILWKQPPGSGNISLTNAGVVIGLVANGERIAGSPVFHLVIHRTLEVEISGGQIAIGPFATVINVRTETTPFSFFLRDACGANPIWIPRYGVAVTEGSDKRSYEEITSSIQAANRQTSLQQIESQPETSYEESSKVTRDQKCVTWLGLSRDIRNFEINFHSMKAMDIWDSVQPKLHGYDLLLPELDGKPVKYDFFCGRGYACTIDRQRWLEKSVLPILNACLADGEIKYNYKIFATLETSALKAENVRGTHYLAADKHAYGSMFTDNQARQAEELLAGGELEQEEETVCYVRVQAVNTSTAARYSYIRIPQPNVYTAPDLFKVPVEYDGSTGYGSYSADRVFLVAQINGKPVPSIETSVLLAPGEKVNYVFMIPHRPISAARASALARASFEEKLAECEAYWENKLKSMASFRLPEKRIEDMMRAGMLHCDIVAYGREPNGAVAPTIGIYSPIGSESAPIMQYFDSVGMHDLARRCIQYFVERQHDDGFMQNCGGYMLETGCILWTIGEHWRYTRDADFFRSIRDNIVKAVDYISAWRTRNKREELRGHGYGMIEGKVADCEDNFHIFMLNSTAYVGIKRAAEVLASIGDGQSPRIAREAEDFLADITDSLDTAFAEAPAVPLLDGSWCPSMPVWAEAHGALCLHADGGLWHSHGTALARDTLVSSQYLLLDEVIEPSHAYADFILNNIADNYFVRNTCFSQPYYSPHPWANLMRGEVKGFLMEFYSNMSALADRETYTFWEHYFYASPHKTHEEAWFLMRCRWMLYLEAGDELRILPGIPRAWMEDSKQVHIDGAVCYFGRLHVHAVSDVSNSRITVRVKVDGEPDRLPRKLVVRVPHPKGKKALSVSTGVYDADKETVTVDGSRGEVEVEVCF